MVCFEVHGHDGSRIGTACTMRQLKGKLPMRAAVGEMRLPTDQEGLDWRSGREFRAALCCEGEPSVTSGDGIRPLAMTRAALEAAWIGRKTLVNIGF